MKKRLIALFGVCAVLGAGIAFGISRPIYPAIAEEAIVEPEPEPETGTVVLPTIEHVKITCSINSGKVGDVAKISIKTDSLWILDYEKLIIRANGEVISKDTFEFVLEAGENKITLENVSVTALFPSPVQELASSILDGNFTWAMLFNPSTIIALISLIATGGVGVALLKVYGKYKKEKTITRDSIVSTLEKIIPGTCEKVISGLVENVISPLIAKVGNVEDAITIFSRCLALVQENTPESRLAILDELSKIKISDVSLVEQVENKIKEALALADVKFQEQLKLLDDMKVANANAIVESAVKLTEKIEETVKKDDGTSI